MKRSFYVSVRDMCSKGKMQSLEGSPENAILFNSTSLNVINITTRCCKIFPLDASKTLLFSPPTYYIFTKCLYQSYSGLENLNLV